MATMKSMALILMCILDCFPQDLGLDVSVLPYFCQDFLFNVNYSNFIGKNLVFFYFSFIEIFLKIFHVAS